MAKYYVNQLIAQCLPTLKSITIIKRQKERERRHASMLLLSSNGI